MILAAVTRRLFWFLLVDQKNGESYKGATVSSVSLEPTNVIDEFRKAVKAENDDDLLKGISSSKLLVYNNKAAFEARNAESGKAMPLEAFLPLSDELGSQGQDPLYVAVPAIVPPPCVIPFYNNVLTVKEKNGWIDFQAQMKPVGKSTGFYIRKSYETIAQAILAGDQDRFIVTGTPGIGKSYFLVYLLWRLVQQQRRVLFIHHPYCIYYDGQGNVFQLKEAPWSGDAEFWTEDLWCLFDAKDQTDLKNMPYELCLFVLSTSPRRDLINDFKKDPLKWFYMPVWSKEEISTISCMYPNAVDWQERFTFLGGVPRLVLENTDKDASGIINQACKACSLSDCLSVVGPESEITEKTKIIHRLVHIASSDPYTDSSVVFASREALNAIIKEHEEEFKANAKRFLSACEGNPLTATFCGSLYERYAIDALEKGGNFTCRPLAHRNKEAILEDETLFIPPSTKRIVDDVLDDQKSYQLYVPKSRTYKGIDAWIPSIGGFQITIATSHPIKDAIANDMKLPQGKLYWVLPVAKYATFNHRILPNIEQFALQFPYPAYFTE